MKTIQRSALVTCILLLAGVANADIVTVQHTMDYQDNSWSGGVWFVEPGYILDHSPFCRACNEDWGWTHVVTDNIPKGATGIESATISIVAWKIDTEYGEDDVIYALPEAPASTAAARTTGTELGLLESALTSPISVAWSSEGQINYYEDLWSITTFELPAEVLDDLWENGQICFYMDIDQTSISGLRATLESAELRINYIAPKPEKPPTAVMHRFWSPVLSSHFYTISDAEVEFLQTNYPHVWTYEGVAFSVLTDDTDTMAVPVHRFWSPVLSSHFYTASDYEADFLINNYPAIWTYEGVVFYVYPPDYQPLDTYPVHRFWSDTLSRHFYTIYDSEVTFLLENYSHVWTYEGIAWYSYMPAK